MQRLPFQFLKRLQEIYPPSIFQRVNSSFKFERPTTFRINLIKSSRREVLNNLKRQGFKLQDAPFLRNCFILLNRSLKDLQETSEYKEGHIYVQGLSSALVVEALSPQEGDLILDLCASPGSKTTQIASLTQNRAKIISVEKIKPRFYKLLSNLKIQGVENIETLLYDGSIIFRRFREEFDKVLLDAPCSSEARFRVDKPRTFLYWSIRKVKEMAHKQRRLILAGLRVLKKGGLLVYSTCTFSPEENEAVINYALERYKNQIAIEALPSLPNSMKGLTRWKDKYFDTTLRKTIRIIPDKFFEGFFIAKIRKFASFNIS